MKDIKDKLVGLSEDEQRQVLMKMLMEDATAGDLRDESGDEDGADGFSDLSELEEGEGEIPDLDEDGRTVKVALEYASRSYSEVFDFSAGAREALIRDCKTVFPLDGSHWIGTSDVPRCALEAMALEVLSSFINLCPLFSSSLFPLLFIFHSS